MSPVSRLRSCLNVVLVLGAVAGGCRKSSTAPATPPPPTERQVSVTVEDSTGARVPSIPVTAYGIDDATGSATVGTKFADAAGVASFTLVDGHWSVFARVAPYNASLRVAASTGIVGPRPAPDTVLFRLVLRTQSLARGKITLAAQSTFDGSLVGVLGLPSFTATDPDGSYELDGLAPGSWTVFAGHSGYQGAQFTLVVPAPGDTIDAGTTVLSPFPVTAHR